ncbi:MAG: hypothetical protein AB8B57_04865 [Congregibacter sp.]
MNALFVFKNKSSDIVTDGEFTLRPLGIEDNGQKLINRWVLSVDGSKDEFTLEHTVANEFADCLVDADRGDHALLAVLFHVMHYGRSLHIDGCVSPTLLKGVETLQTIWSRWRSRIYSQIQITANLETELQGSHSRPGSLIAFSGGVDGTFSTFRHYREAAGRNSSKPGAALLVHGMDIALHRSKEYEGAVERARVMLASTDISLVQFSVNSRLLRQEWEDSFSVQLGSCFLMLQRGFAAALQGSGEPYEDIFFPWSSTPFTDHLISTPCLDVRVDGCDFSRTEKVDWLARETDVVGLLRVCWEGARLDENCGECEKCIRTMLNFWASANVVPPTLFERGLTLEAVRSVRPRNPVQIAELKQVLKHARRNGLEKTPTFHALTNVIRKAVVKTELQRLAEGVKAGLRSM